MDHLFFATLIHVFSTPGQSQGLLYKHRCN
jgi:hypothetical protein